MWLDYDLTKDEKWKKLAEKYTEDLDSVKYLKWHHDVGFMIGCSYLTGYRLCKKPEYKDVIVTAAQSLSTRFRPVARLSSLGMQTEDGKVNADGNVRLSSIT